MVQREGAILISGTARLWCASCRDQVDVVGGSSPSRSISKLSERSRIQLTLLNVTWGACGTLSADPPLPRAPNRVLVVLDERI